MAADAATQPGQPLTDREVSTLCTSLGQNNPTLAQMTVVKRLLFECQTINLKATVEQQPDSVLRKLPGAERAQRLELQAQRLGGLSIEHDLEPAFSVYDAVSTQVEQGSLKYLHPSKIPTRRQELAQGKPAKELVLDASRSRTKPPRLRPNWDLTWRLTRLCRGGVWLMTWLAF